MSAYRSVSVFFSWLAALAILTACGGKTTVVVTSTPQPATPTPTPTPVPPRTLTVCLGQEPTSLYLYGSLTSTARSVLSAVYDGPIDTNSYGYQPVLLQRLPNLANGDAQLFPKSVYVGDEVVGADGLPVTLQQGVKVWPSGCRSNDCAVVFDGKSEIQMDQIQATFNMLPNLTWSDGQPLTADDSVYSYQVAADPKTPGSKYLTDRTQSYEAADATTVQWWGKPGFIDPTYFTNFWTPLPKHLLSQTPVDQLADTDAAAHQPVGWGPYVIQEWVAGDHITLAKNTHYFRASEGLPKFDTLTFRFKPDPQAALSALMAGQCDLLDPSISLDGQVSLLRTMNDQNELKAYFTDTMVMEQLVLGIRPASYENGYTIGFDRPDFLSDKRVRQAIAMCLDRQKVVDTVLFGLTTVPISYLPQQHPLYNPDVHTYSFDVTAAGQLLDQAGWRKVDNDPASPRQAWGVADVPSGTPLVLNYLTTGALQRTQVSTILAASLAQCGIKVNVQYLDQAALYAPGPGGPLFGRAFDLAEFAIGSTGIEPPCEWYTSSEVPNAANHWVGTNISGYSNPLYDKTCLLAQQSLPDDPVYADYYHQTASILAEDLPIIPLYWRVKAAASRPDLCNFSLDPTATSNLWNIEAFDIRATCSP